MTERKVMTIPVITKIESNEILNPSGKKVPLYPPL